MTAVLKYILPLSAIRLTSTQILLVPRLSDSVPLIAGYLVSVRTQKRLEAERLWMKVTL